MDYKDFMIHMSSTEQDLLANAIFNNLPHESSEKNKAQNDIEKEFLNKVYDKINIYRYLCYRYNKHLLEMININEQLLSQCKILSSR